MGAQIGANAVDLLLEGRVNAVSILQWNRNRGFYLDGADDHDFRDRWGVIHARQMHPAFPETVHPSQHALRLTGKGTPSAFTM